jgi:hypothetical protein
VTIRPRKPYNGKGVTVPAVVPSFLPPEPAGGPLTVQVYCLHEYYGNLPVFGRMVSKFLPRGWIDSPWTWAALCRLGGGPAPTVLEPREVAP